MIDTVSGAHDKVEWSAPNAGIYKQVAASYLHRQSYEENSYDYGKRNHNGNC